jgi:signal transduction histidine kinase/CheY-like chemotaxis protein/HPt (histidine-containing phosphotransfer) domain-containing protein
MNAIVPDSEKLRLIALKELQILDTLPEQEFDDITLLASQICETPIAAVSLIDESRQWFKSEVGLGIRETPRSCAFCDHAIKGEGLFVVTDASQDARFAANPLVTGDPNIRFYAGAPLATSDGYKLGTLCVIDRQPRSLSDAQQRALGALARSVMSLIEARSTRETQILAGTENLTKLFSKKEENTSREISFFNRYVKYYLVATFVILAVTLVRLLMESTFQIGSPFLLFAFAILLSAWRGGFGAGIYATLAATFVINHFFLPPYTDLFAHDYKENLIFLIFIGQGVFISALCSSRLKKERLLYQAGKDLENRVTNRTTQLAQANRELKQEIQERNWLQEDLRRARDTAIESARLKSEFLANMSHEIRTPMNGVIGMTGLLLETDLDDEQKRFAQTIRTSGESLLTIINDILDFSKVEAGKLELETLDFNLRDTIESLVEMFSSRAREQKNELAALIYSDVPLLVRGDAGRIRQILTNLIGNAIKFTKYGDIMIRAEKLRETANRVHLKISVTDTGEGISNEVQARLFQPFTQSDASTTRRYGGTGLGLSISKKLVEMMNGEIGLESKAGRGSIFWFNITLEKQEAVSPAGFEQPNSVYTNPELSGKRVLIVDDNQVNREVLMYQTRSWKMQTFEAADGVNAINLLEKSAQPFDLVILDLQMPIMDGLETAETIISKQLQSPPILMISSSTFKIEEEGMQQLGIKAFLNKPYRQSDLLKAVYKSLGIKSDENFDDFEDSNIHITATVESIDFCQMIDKPKRILIVEDNSVNQLVAQNLLKKFGYSADVAANGREALQALEIIPYDLVLMDCQMPEMDGYEATREIRARDWAIARIPIVALTAHATAGEREKCLKAGMDDYLSKPIVKESLHQVLAQWLVEKEPRELIIETVNPIVAPPDVASNAGLPETPPAESTVEPDVPAVDFATLDDITDNNDEMRREVVGIYLEQTAANLLEIEQAISGGNAKRIYDLAHKTVGGSALCGMVGIVAPMRKLEQLGREGRAGDAFPFFMEAQNAFAAIEKACREKILVDEEILCEK